MTIEGQPLSPEFKFSTLKLKTAYKLTFSHKQKTQTAHITFIQSANVPTMFIQIPSGRMEQMHSSASNREHATIITAGIDGSIQCTTRGMINIRGNSTFALAKKPYHLSLDSEKALLGMASSRHWILLANGFDQTNLRNKIVYDVARQSGFSWSPRCEFVDVYINGSYNGLYLLSEQIELGKKLLAIDTKQGSWLGEIIQHTKIKKKDTVFMTRSGRFFRVVSPQKCSQSKLRDIQDIMDTFENTLSNTMSTQNESPIKIDLDSIARRYLIDEIFINRDSDLASSYYHWNAQTNTLFAGPIWDYDLSLGNDSSLSTQRSRFSCQLYAIYRPYYCHLYSIVLDMVNLNLFRLTHT